MYYIMKNDGDWYGYDKDHDQWTKDTDDIYIYDNYQDCLKDYRRLEKDNVGKVNIISC